MIRVAALVVMLAACSSKAAPVHLACERTIAGLDAHLAPGAIVWFGEVHGTAESPKFVGDVACQAARVGKVQLGLEISSEEQPRIDHYVRSKGTAADRTALLDGAFWRHHDGRSSEAMVALIDRVRTMRATGAAIDIVAYDELPGAPDRDAVMADFVAGARDPKAIFVALSGNIHSRRIVGTRWDPNLLPLVASLVKRGLAVVTFDVAASGGTFWACTADGPNQPQQCGVHVGAGNEPGAPWTLGPPRHESHDGIYRVGATTASPPALP